MLLDTFCDMKQTRGSKNRGKRVHPNLKYDFRSETEDTKPESSAPPKKVQTPIESSLLNGREMPSSQVSIK